LISRFIDQPAAKDIDCHFPFVDARDSFAIIIFSAHVFSFFSRPAKISVHPERIRRRSLDKRHVIANRLMDFRRGVDRAGVAETANEPQTIVPQTISRWTYHGERKDLLLGGSVRKAKALACFNRKCP
jgi:hypothetical protein